MSRQANCPNCGAPIQFRWSSAVQTTCEYCNSILVRHDVDLQKVGQQADLPADASPIQLGTEGQYGGLAFQVVGRILYEYEGGGWNEWHILYNNGASGWLSDAQAEYAVTAQLPEPGVAPSENEVRRGQYYTFAGISLQVTSVTTARYVGVQGELPFEYWDKQAVRFADLRSHDRRFATIDYSENPPLVFIGEAVEFGELRLSNLRTFEGW